MLCVPISRYLGLVLGLTSWPGSRAGEDEVGKGSEVLDMAPRELQWSADLIGIESREDVSILLSAARAKSGPADWLGGRGYGVCKAAGGSRDLDGVQHACVLARQGEPSVSWFFMLRGGWCCWKHPLVDSSTSCRYTEGSGNSGVEEIGMAVTWLPEKRPVISTV